MNRMSHVKGGPAVFYFASVTWESDLWAWPITDVTHECSIYQQIKESFGPAYIHSKNNSFTHFSEV